MADVIKFIFGAPDRIIGFLIMCAILTYGLAEVIRAFRGR